MRRLLVRLYPRRWRDDYGEGFARLLDETPLSAGIVVDCVRGAGTAHLRGHPLAAAIGVSAIWFMVAQVLALRSGVTANLVWAPTSPARSLMLLSTFVPPIGLMARARGRVPSCLSAP